MTENARNGSTQEPAGVAAPATAQGRLFDDPCLARAAEEPAQQDHQPAQPRPAADQKPVLEKRACLAISPEAVSYPQASFAKRFGRNLAATAKGDNPQITDRQRAQLWRQVWRFRRQIPDCDLVRIAEQEREKEQNA
jgi:hypothetical protein